MLPFEITLILSLYLKVYYEYHLILTFFCDRTPLIIA